MATQRRVGAAAEVLMERFGGLFTEAESAPSAAATSGSIVGNNPDCMARLVVNLSSNTVYLGLSPAVSASNGIAVGANGGSVSLSVEEDFGFVTRELFAIAPAGSSQLYVLQLSRYQRSEVMKGPST
jgi:hypothetical protein